MTDAAVNLVVGKLEEFAVNEYLIQAGLANKIALLRDKFEWLQTFIRDADQKRHQQGGEYIAVWVRQTRDVAFEVEDTLDQFFLEAAVDCDGCVGSQGCIQLLLRGSAVFWLRRQLSDQIERMENRLEKILYNKDKYNIAVVPSAWMSWAPTRTDISNSWKKCALSSIDEDLVNMKVQIRQVTEYVLKYNRELLVSLIMCEKTAGCGTTSLARKIYNTPRIRQRFDCRAWVTIPKAFCTEDILNEIIRQVRPPEVVLNQDMSEMHPGDKLHNYLLNRRYLVVLDSLPSFEAWLSLTAAFPVNRNYRSRVLIVAPCVPMPTHGYTGDFPIVRVYPLDVNNAKKLFQRYGYVNCPDEFFPMMYQKTKGIPLAIVMLAGVLKSKEVDQWIQVLENIPKNADALTNILSLSFHDLLPHFKSCFLYLAALGQESEIDAQRLIRLWIAEGFIQKEKGKTMEQLGQDYLKELISRYLIQLVHYNQTNVLKISIHDGILQFARSEARETNFLGVHDGNEIVAPTVRRLYFRDKTGKHAFRIFRASKLRSILGDVSEDQPLRINSIWNNNKIILGNIFRKSRMINEYEFMLTKARFLRVIELKGARVCALPKEIGTMIYLRYLGLIRTGLTNLPSSVAKLQNLQTLDTTDTDVSQVEEAFWNIETLRHVITKKLSPPKAVGILDNLHTLIGVGYGTWVKGMEKMSSLRILQMWGLSRTDSTYLLIILRKLGCLVSLDLRGENFMSDDSQGEIFPFDEFSKIGFQCLRTLRLFGQIETIQSQIILPNLVNLTLVSTKVTQNFIFELKGAAYLERLELGKDSYVGNTLEIHDRMGCLKYLVLADLDDLLEWKYNPRNFCLSHITISNCPNLKTLPNFINMKKKLIKITKKLEVYNSPRIFQNISDEDVRGKLIDVHSVLTGPVTIN